MENRSVYEYIKDNTDINGILDPDSSLKDYSIDLQKDWDIYSGDNLYLNKSSLDLPLGFEDEINKVEFKLYNTFEDCIKDMDFTKIEEYLDTTTFSVRDNIEQLEERLNRNIENVDKKKLLKLCKVNIIKTQSFYMVYIYLLILSKLNIKEDKDIQDIVMRFAITHEFVGFINDYVLDECSYPDYNRFYIAKRIKDSEDIGNLIAKMKIDNQEVKEWILFSYTNNYNSECITYFFDKLELDKLLSSKGKDRRYFLAMSHFIRYFILECKKDEEYDCFTKVLKEYIKKISNYTDDLEVYCKAAEIYIALTDSNLIIEDKILLEDEKDEIIDKFKEALLDKSAIELIKEKLKGENRIVTSNLCNIISKLNIKELALILYNCYKQDPIDNCTLLFAIKTFSEVHEKAVELLYEKINWDDIIGEYENVRRTSDIFHPVEILIDEAREYESIAMKIYSKTLRAKALIFRQSTINELRRWYYNEGISVNDYSKELIESLMYVEKNDLNTTLRRNAEGLLRNNLSSVIDVRLEDGNLFDLVGKNDEKVKEENNIEIDWSYRELYLNSSRLFGKLSMDECTGGLNVLTARKLVYFNEMEDGYYGFVQGNKFGTEYMVKLLKDKDYRLTEAICNCGNNTKEKFCKHVCALLIRLNKLNEDKENEEESQKDE